MPINFSITGAQRKFLGKGLLLGLCMVTIEAQAANDLQQCAGNLDNVQRLKCYDDLAHQQAVVMPNVELPALTDKSALPDTPSNLSAEKSEKEEREKWSGRSYLTKAWNLDGRGREGGEQLAPVRPYRSSYLILRNSIQPNRLPYSPAAGHSTTTPLDLDVLEAKFQFSFKAEVLSYRQINWFNFDTFRLWGAYTQQSNWQAFNSRNSSPFRETNYEPELIATFGTENPQGLKLVNVGLAHQSNGRSLGGSRSWNRLYVQGGWEWDDNWSVLARGWWRLPESNLVDDNPDIQSYLGVADALIRWEPDETQSVAVLLRNNLRTSQNRGFMQIDWTTPVFVGKSAKLHAQVSSGYGESLIDYNHRQTTYGLGVSFREW